MTLSDIVFQRLLGELKASVPKDQLLNGALRLLAKWRSTLIQNAVVQKYGTVVLDGPFRGMAFLAQSAEGCHVPKLLGCYEREIHPVLARIADTPYRTILNIGCAEGYYAVGMARLLPQATVHAYDTNERAQAACRRLAQMNAVADRVHVGGVFQREDAAQFTGQRTLLVCDIEGGERELLDPDAAPALRELDILVECHDCFAPGLSSLLADRFAPSHRVMKIAQAIADRRLPDLFAELGDLDRLLAIWEWRTGPTPWLWMESHVLRRESIPCACEQRDAT